MIEKILEMNGVLYTVITICAVSLIIKIQLLLLYKKLIREAAAPGRKRKCSRYVRQYIKEITNGFEMEYRSSYYVNNVSVFVDRYLYDVRLSGVRYSTWETMGVIAVLMCLIAGMAGAFGAYYYEFGQDHIIRYTLEGLAVSGIIVMADAFIDIQRRKEQLHTNICNYLENYMKPRLEKGDYSYRLEECARLSDEVDAGMMALIESLNESGTPSEEEPDEVSEAILEAERQQGIGNSSDGHKDKPETTNIVNNTGIDDGRILEDVIREYLT